MNPLVSLTALPTLSPFVRSESDGAVVDGQGEIEEFLKREGVDVVVGCDLARADIVCLYPFLVPQPFFLHPGHDDSIKRAKE